MVVEEETLPLIEEWGHTRILDHLIAFKRNV